MYLRKYLLALLLVASSFAMAEAATQPLLTLDLQPAAGNPAAPLMGDHLHFLSTITNTGATPIEGLVAWISLVEVDLGNEQPVDLEDWSAHKAITGASLLPAETLRTDWPMRLIKGGDYRVVISVTDRDGREVYTSPTVQFHVRQKKVIQASRVLPAAAGIPLLIVGLLTFSAVRKRHLKEQIK